MASDVISFASLILHFTNYVRGTGGKDSEHATQALLALNAACEATLSYEAHRDKASGERDYEREIKVGKAWDDVAVWVGKLAKKDESAAILVTRLQTKGSYWCAPDDVLPEDIERLGIGLNRIKADVQACMRRRQ